jgi:hypothetical protein
MRVVVYGPRPDGHTKVIAKLAADDSRLELVGLVIGVLVSVYAHNRPGVDLEAAALLHP